MPHPEPSDRVDEVAYRVIGAAIEVHRQLGPGLVLEYYEGALARELVVQGLKIKQRVPVPVEYKGHIVGELHLGLLVEDELLVAVRVEELAPLDRAHIVAQLQHAKLELGLLINFNVALLKDGIRRVVRTKPN